MLLPGDTDHHAQWVAECCPALEREGGSPSLPHSLVIPCEGRSGTDIHGKSLAEEMGLCEWVESAKGKAVAGEASGGL